MVIGNTGSLSIGSAVDPGDWKVSVTTGDTRVYLGNDTVGSGAYVDTGAAVTGYAAYTRNDAGPILWAGNNGRIGVGNSSPGDILDVTTTTPGEGARVGNLRAGVWAGGADSMALVHDTVSGTANNFGLRQHSSGDTYLSSPGTVYLCNSGTEVARVTSTGLGIGGVAPSTALEVTGDAQFNNSVTISGDLTVSGDFVQMSVATLAVEDPFIKLADGNTGDAVDMGFYGTHSGGTYTGLFRDATDSVFKLFDGLTEEPGTTLNVAGAGYTLAGLQVGDLIVDGAMELTGGVKYSVADVTSSRSLTAQDHIVTVDASAGIVVITVPQTHAGAPTLIGHRFVIARVDSSTNSVFISLQNNDVFLNGMTSTIDLSPGDRISLVALGGAGTTGRWLTNV